MSQSCRECGCTAERACMLYEDGEPILTCSWAEPDLCTACVPDADPDWFHLPTARLIAQTIRQHAFRFENDDELEELLEACLRLSGFDVDRRVRIDLGRVDLLADRIGIEVKLDGTADELERHVRRYVHSAALDELVLVTSHIAHEIPDEIEGKPVQVVSLAEESR